MKVLLVEVAAVNTHSVIIGKPTPTTVICAPGNAGTALWHKYPGDTYNFKGQASGLSSSNPNGYCRPEVPLVEGMVDFLMRIKS